MYANTARKKSSIVAVQHPPQWPVTLFSSLNRSHSEKSNRLHQQFDTGPYIRNATVCNLPCQYRDKWHLNFQDVCFLLDRLLPHLSISMSHTTCVSEQLTPCSLPTPGDKTHTAAWKQLDLTTCLDCLLPVCWFFTHTPELRAQNIASWFFFGNNKKKNSLFKIFVVFSLFRSFILWI